MTINAELLRDFRQLVAELSLISHISGTAYEGKLIRATDESKGGRKPPGGDQDKPIRPGVNATTADRAEYQDALTSWLESYQRRTPSYFAAEFDKCSTRARLLELTEEARQTVAAWKKPPAPIGEEPKSMAEPGWRWWVANVDRKKWTAEKIARRYNCTRRYINKIWAAETIILGPDLDPENKREDQAA